VKKLIGTGSFSKVYQISKNKVEIHSSDPVKECMSLGWFPNSRLFPRIKRTKILYDQKYNIYESRLYEKVNAPKKQLKKSHYKMYLELRKIDGAILPPRGNRVNNLIEAIKKSNLSRHWKEIINNAIYSLSDYGDDVVFEISPRNIAVSNGNLVLLDCFFMENSLFKHQIKDW
jgi:hypothetical protein